jgi:glycosyltransferase involved in cell wall biosynthesis
MGQIYTIKVYFWLEINRLGCKNLGEKILFVGRITPEKGVHVLLEAYNKIAPHFPNLQINLVGSLDTLPKDHLVGPSEEKQINDLEEFYTGGDYYSNLLSILPERLRENVRFAGSVRYSTIANLYRQADILVNPALSEPFGRSLVEANACGVPIVAARAGGTVELVDHGKNGLLVEPGDANELAQALQKLLEDHSLRRKMGSNGRQFVLERFSWDSIRSNLVAQYRDLLAPV